MVSEKEFNTVTAIFKVVKDLFDSYNNGDCTIGALINYLKAFRTLDHKFVIYKFGKYVLNCMANSWIESHLSTRQYRVFCYSLLSKVIDVAYGVPHGSLLGPLFSIIYETICSNF